MALHASANSCLGSRVRGGAAASLPALPRPASQQTLFHRHVLRQSSGLEAATSSPLCSAEQRFSGDERRRGHTAVCHAYDPKDRGGKALQLNPAYVAIIGGFALLFLFRNPYIFAVLTILTIIPQNSAVTSLNSLVLIFYDSGLFMNFAEAVYCVRLISWVSIACTLISFALFA